MGGKISNRYILFNKAAQVFVPWHNPGCMKGLLHTWGKRFVNWYWEQVAKTWIKEYKVPEFLVPESEYVRDVATGGVICQEFFDLVNQGKILTHKASIERFVPGTNKLVLDNGITLECDVVVFATGFKSCIPFDIDCSTDLQIPTPSRPNILFRLYRGIIPVHGPRNFGVIGFPATISHCLTCEVSAHWLSELFLGSLQLPSEPDMTMEVDRVQKHMREADIDGGRGLKIGLAVIPWAETHLVDMKVSITRTSNFISEYFMPVYPYRYSTLHQERASVRQGKKAGKVYIGFWNLIILLLVLTLARRYLL